MTELIRHRRPEKMDEDWNGEVLMQRFPSGVVSSRGATYALVAAAHVGPGVPWRRTDIWEPPATPEPEPEAPKPAPKPELRVGQVWRSREGRDVTIEKVHPGTTYPFGGSDDRWYTSDGRWQYYQASRFDLVELIYDAPADAAQPEPAPATRKVPRGFSAFYDMPKNLNGGPKRIFIAIATDGTAWSREPDDCGGGWSQVEPLPDREEPIDA